MQPCSAIDPLLSIKYFAITLNMFHTAPYIQFSKFQIQAHNSAPVSTCFICLRFPSEIHRIDTYICCQHKLKFVSTILQQKENREKIP